MSDPARNGLASHISRQYETLLRVSQAIAIHGDFCGLLRELAERLQPVVHFDEAGVDLYHDADRTMRLYALTAPPAAANPAVVAYPVDEIPTGCVWQTQRPLLLGLPGETRWPRFTETMRRRAQAASFCIFPLTTARRRLGTLGFVSRQPVSYDASAQEFLQQVANQVAVAVENALTLQQVEELRHELERDKFCLAGEVRARHNFQEIIGRSPALSRVLRDVETVAPTDSTVLIRGETGTGKELVARAIHHLSRRRERAFVKVNCAAIPTGLLESELFGHEKGAFTGAISQKIGRFELAHQGTLFLDEVGDIPLELQPKLLRVLQDQEFERLGSTRTHRVEVRVMAATNRDLARMVEEGSFRRDLFYRLHVFPVVLPPLRDRREDIPDLVGHFAQKFAQRMGKSITTISADVLAALTSSPWPGNIRELENFIERGVILSAGSELVLPTGELMPTPAAASAATSLAAAEREHILRVLTEVRWVLGGPNGAAARLGIKRSHLQWKLKKLGIARPAL